jgi:hypothetical protein
LILGLALLVPLAAYVVVSSRGMQSPRLSALVAIPGEQDEFTDEEVRFAIMPFNHAAATSVRRTAGRVRITNHRLLIIYRPPLWKEDVIGAMIYRPGATILPFDPFKQNYPIFTSDPRRLQTLKPNGKVGQCVRMVPIENTTYLPSWIEIETSIPEPYQRALGA